MTSIILVHTFAPHPDEHYTALPAEEGQPVSYVRRIVVEGDSQKALELAGGFLREGEAVSNTHGVPGLELKPVNGGPSVWVGKEGQTVPGGEYLVAVDTKRKSKSKA